MKFLNILGNSSSMKETDRIILKFKGKWMRVAIIDQEDRIKEAYIRNFNPGETKLKEKKLWDL